MQLFVLLLFVGLFAQDGMPVVPNPAPVSIFMLPKLALAWLIWLACRVTLKRLQGPDAARRLRRLDRISAFYRVSILVLYFLDLTGGVLQQLKVALGDMPLIPDLLFLTPPLLLLVWDWWCHYPIDRRLREAQLLRRIDEGLPIYPIWTRGQYIAAQFRFQIALLFVPLALLLLLGQLTDRFVAERWAMGIHLIGAGCVFLFAPVMVRHMWDTVPLPKGELRDRLMAMCRTHRIGVSELLLWRTYGGMINAAVMGLIRPLRYVLLSDGLLELLPAREVEAVMAHELGHLRHRHMIWMLLAATAMSMGLTIAWTALLIAAQHLVLFPDQWFSSNLDPALIPAVGAVACWIVGFGWMSRRFERQADTFAVQHLAIASATIDAESVQAMVDALEQVARLNHIAPERRSWRHGSIIWRQNYLRSLVGQHADRLAIDRQIALIQVLAVLVIGVGIAVMWVTR